MVAILLSLPNEILHKIVPLLPADAYLAVRLTCTELNSSVPSRNETWELDHLLRIERWLCYTPAGRAPLQVRAREDSFACSFCKRIRRAISFTNRMMKGPRGKWGTPAKRRSRLCIRCRYLSKPPHGTMVHCGGLRGKKAFACSKCNVVLSNCRWSEREPPPLGGWVCVSCEARRDGTDVFLKSALKRQNFNMTFERTNLPGILFRRPCISRRQRKRRSQQHAAEVQEE